MAFSGYLSEDEREAVSGAIRGAVGYDNALRRILLDGIHRDIVDNLAGWGQPPGLALRLDLIELNQLERLTDGTIPLLPFLRNALSLGGVVAAMDPVRDALAKVESLTSGAPRIDIAALPEIKEKIIGRDDMVTYRFMESGIMVAQSVAKLEVPRFENGQPHLTGGSQTVYLGTGWIVAPDLLITNHHVLNARNDGEAAASEQDLNLQAEATRARFDFNFESVAGEIKPLTELVAWDPGLDFAIARIDGGDRAPLALTAAPVAPVTTDTYMPVNVIQHPDGRPKRFGIRNNLVTAATERELRYFTDTDGGSSGSPVLDDDWKVVALHRGATLAKGVRYQGRETAYVNLGTQIHAILSHLAANHPGLVARP